MQIRYTEKDFRRGSLFFLLGVLMACAGCGKASSQQWEAAPPVSTTEPKEKAKLVADTAPPKDTLAVAPPDTLRVIGVGDMMLGTNYPSTGYLPPNGGRDLLADVEEVLRSAEVTFGNLEGVILDEGGTPKRCNNPDLCYVFRSPKSYNRHFERAGFDLLSIANNHSGDFGPAGRRLTKAALQEVDIAYAGLAGSDEYAIIERDSVRYGFCAFSPNNGTCSIHDLDQATSIVRQLAEQTDIVIVSFHGGAEGARHQHVPRKTETYYGENRGDVHRFAHAVVDAGADIVFGHGPHVTRAAEVYQDRFIIYSLGNFCTYGRFNLRGPAGIAPLVEVHLNREGQFLGGRVVPVYQRKTHGPKIDPQKRATKKLIELTRADFPETALRIEAESGRMYLAE